MRVFPSLVLVLCLYLGFVADAADAAAWNVEADIGKERQRQLEELNVTAEQFYQLILEEKLELSLVKLEVIGRQISEMSFSGLTSIEGLQALVQAVTDAKRNLVAITPDLLACQTSAAKIRLAADALRSRNSPMWKQYYRLMKADAEHLLQSVKLGNTEEANRAYTSLMERYQMIEPAVLISLGPDPSVMFRRQLEDVGHRMDGVSSYPKATIELITQLEPALQTLFGQTDQSAYVPLPEPHRPVYWTVMIGSFIVIVLLLVAMRKYRHEQGYVNVSGKGKGRPPQ